MWTRLRWSPPRIGLGSIERAEVARAAIVAVGDPAQIGPVRSASLFGTVLAVITLPVRLDGYRLRRQALRNIP